MITLAIILISLWPTLFLYRKSFKFLYLAFYEELYTEPTWLGVAIMLLAAPIIMFPFGLIQVGMDISEYYRRKELSTARSHSFAKRVSGESKAERLQRQQKEIAERDARIKQLEKELEL